MSRADGMHARNRKAQMRDAGGARLRGGRAHFIYAVILALLCLALAAGLRADTISGTVKDPSGAVVAGARIEISGGSLAQAIVLTSDETGKFAASNLNPGSYSVRVVKDGFDDLVKVVELQGTSELALNLTIAEQKTSVNVSEKNSAFANSDAGYRQLRDMGLGDTYRLENFTLNMDAGVFQFKSGTITFLALVDRFETGAIFVGQGHFTLQPGDEINKREMLRRSGVSSAEEDFSEAVFRFTGNQYVRFTTELGGRTETPPEAAAAFARWKEKVRRRREIPEGFTQAILQSETIDNVDADVLAALDNPKHPAFFNAYMHGTPHKDLRFFIRVRVDAIPQQDYPEEVALINCNGGELDDGVWYSAHLLSEQRVHTANSREDKRLFATRRYNIETVIAKNDHLFGRATITFEPLLAGERVMKFGLLPTLRVTRVTDQNGQDLHFVRETEREDGSFYAILNEAPAMGQEHAISVDYVGDKVLEDAGNGSYYVSARDSWYPNVGGGGFGEKSLYDITFKVAHGNTVIGVGDLKDSGTEAGFAVTRWVTPVPVSVAGFNI